MSVLTLQSNLATLLIIIITGCSVSEHNQTKIPPTRPNIIFIMADDHTQRAMSLYGSQLISTPNLDRIGREGIRFDRSFVTNSICGPSRAVLLTGKYSHLNGVRTNADRLNSEQSTFPQLLQQAGYHTALVGKWHLKSQPKGFDFWSILTGQGYYYNPDFIRMGDTLHYEGYSTDIIHQLAMEVIEKRDTTQPFCLLFQHNAPHRNWMPALEDLPLFEDREFPLPPTFFDDYQNRSQAVRQQDMRIADMFLSMDMKLQPAYYQEETGTGGMADFDAQAFWNRVYQRLSPQQKIGWDRHYDRINREFQKLHPQGKDLVRWKYQRYMRDYLKCVVAVDRSVGQLLDYLDQHGLTDNTLVIYTSDQGFYLGEHGWYDKRFMYEPSFSMPLVMRYPSVIPAGSTTDALALNLDFAPTLLDFAGVPIPETFQGHSLRPICEGKEPENWRTSIYYHYYQSQGWHQVPKHYGVRTDRYKLLQYYETEDWELYDLQLDSLEMKNVYTDAKYESVRNELTAELKRLQEQYQVDEH